jgi:hypothetical protein
LRPWLVPNLRPGELVISTVARYFEGWGNLDVQGLADTALEIRWKRAHPNALGPTALLAASLYPNLPYADAAQRILWKHTLLPYHLAFVPEEIALRFVEAAIHSRRPRGQSLEWAHIPNYGTPNSLRLCRICVARESNELGEAVWHRTHQLPAVVTCPVHGTTLLESVVARTGAWHELLSAATAARQLLRPARAWFGQELSTRVAHRSLATLGKRRASRCYYSPQSYRAKLLALGFRGKGAVLAVGRFAQDFDDWLRLHGCRLEQLGMSSWYLNLVTNLQRATTPLQHILLQEFICDVSSEAQATKADHEAERSA